MAQDNVNNNVPENEDAALDAELQRDFGNVRAGKALGSAEPSPAEAPVDTPPTEDKAEEPSGEAPKTDTEVPSNGAPDSEKKDNVSEEQILPLPAKSKFESDEVYEKRAELLSLVKQKKQARTDERRNQLSDQIKKTRNELATLSGTDNKLNHLTPGGTEDKPKEDVDPATAADIARLKAIGGVTQEDLERVRQEERLANGIRNTLDGFVQRHPEFKDPDEWDVFSGFVESNYNWAGKTGKELMTVLELAREALYKPSETVQERILKGANVAEKVNKMQFPGGTIARTGLNADQKQSVKEMMETGMSEEKALELISE